MARMTEIRTYEGHCGVCGEGRRETVRVKMDDTLLLDNGVETVCCGKSFYLKIAAVKIKRPFGWLRRIFEPAPCGPSPGPMPIDETRAFERGEQPWLDRP